MTRHQQEEKNWQKMMNDWTNEDIEAIMIQLNKQKLPFKRCEFSALGEGMKLLGSGSSANVYEAMARGNRKNAYAIKVIGFDHKHVDSQAFRSAVLEQAKLGSENSIVEVYDALELRVWIEGEHDVVKTERVDPQEASKPEGSYLHLQFILMEKLSPVFVSHRLKHDLFPLELGRYDEKEIMKLAYEIGTAIHHAHKEHLIHRDIKLENIFYDAKQRQYKLGDFGIAKVTADGMASTVAFTKGYGAPEVVGTLTDKYDCTADIYSFGMLLYVLYNEMRFPGSMNYHPTVYQYVQGYVPPDPINASDEMASIIQKMICFDPDERYQSMEEVLNEFDQLNYGRRFKYQREHKSLALTLGTAFAITGAAVLKLSFLPELQFEFSIWVSLFCILCIGKSILTIYKRKTWLVSIAIFVVGGYLLIGTDFVWWRWLLLFLATAFSDYWIGVFGASVVGMQVTYLIQKAHYFPTNTFAEYRWTAVLLLSLSVVLLFTHTIAGERSEKSIKNPLGKGWWWPLITVTYSMVTTLEWSLTTTQGNVANLNERILGEQGIHWILSWNPKVVGICGATFCLIWMMRERVMIFIDKRREKWISMRHSK